ncbi:MAG: hypothetical protein ACP5P1_11900 [Acidimicrobiales bacterium]
MLIASVITDVSGIDKQFDYCVPPGLADSVEVGSQVRVDLAGRRVGAWVTALRPAERPVEDSGASGSSGIPSLNEGPVSPGLSARPRDGQLKAIAALRGHGPQPDVVDLAGWAAWRWAGRRGHFLGAASADRAVPRLVEPRLARPAPPSSQRLPTGGGVHVVRVGPAADPTPLVAEAAQLGAILVVVPTHSRASALAFRLRRAGGDVALLPDGWAQARSGAAVVLGSRRAVWAPCPGMAAIVVVDAHDELHISEAAPTWSAVTVAAERTRRLGLPCYLLSSCPGAELLALGPLWNPDPDKERSGWANLEVVDQREEDPRSGLYSERVVELVRTPRRVACVLNRTGRTRLLACSNCGAVARCEVCEAAVSSPQAGLLSCRRCGATRPYVCSYCTSIRLSALRIGTSRAREDLERLSGRQVGEVTRATAALPDADVLVGTEALLRRLDPAAGFEVVVFLDFDQELLAPRISAAEHSLALVSSASRLVRGRRGTVLLQTRTPRHYVIQAAEQGDPGVAVEAERHLRAMLRLPPFAAVAVVSGEAAPGWVESLRALQSPELEVHGPSASEFPRLSGPNASQAAGHGAERRGALRGEWLVKAPDHRTLCDALSSVDRPAGRLRIAVDPANL